MDDSTNRIIGQLQAHHQDTHARLIQIEKKIDELQIFRWRLAGVSTILAFVVSSFGVALAEFLLRTK